MKNANDDFKEYIGSETFYEHGFSKCLITEGVFALSEKYQCHWLVDLIYSHQSSKKVQDTPFQVWKLKKVEGDSFIAICEDGNNNRVTSQEIPFSDFEATEATLWLVDKVLMLPSEY